LTAASRYVGRHQAEFAVPTQDSIGKVNRFVQRFGMHSPFLKPVLLGSAGRGGPGCLTGAKNDDRGRQHCKKTHDS
jgi:hypothetical protein